MLAFIISTQTFGEMNGLPLKCCHNEEKALSEEAAVPHKIITECN